MNRNKLRKQLEKQWDELEKEIDKNEKEQERLVRKQEKLSEKLDAAYDEPDKEIHRIAFPSRLTTTSR